MASAGTYDEKLLSQAPEVTRADLQDGYNADLLREPTVKRTSTTRATPLRSDSGTLQQQFQSRDQDLESSAVHLQPKQAAKYADPPKPWWRTVKGVTIIVVVTIIIILVAVLGGVLGSRNRRNHGEQSGVVQGAAVSSISSSSRSSTSSIPSPSSTTGTTQGSASNSNGNGGSDGSTGQGSNNPLTGGPVVGSAPVAGTGGGGGGGGNGGNNGVGRRADW